MVGGDMKLWTHSTQLSRVVYKLIFIELHNNQVMWCVVIRPRINKFLSDVETLLIYRRNSLYTTRIEQRKWSLVHDSSTCEYFIYCLKFPCLLLSRKSVKTQKNMRDHACPTFNLSSNLLTFIEYFSYKGVATHEDVQ